MVNVELEDVSIERLRREAQRLGIDEATTKSKGVLIPEIRAARLTLPPTRERWFNRSTVFSLLSLLASLAAVAGAWGQWWYAGSALATEIESMNKQEANLKKEDWQRLIVYSIIEKKFTEQSNEYTGVPFDTIRSEYLAEAASVTEIDMGKNDIQPQVLRKIIFDLMQSGLVYMTYDKKYAVDLSELLPGFGRTMIKQKAGYYIISLLAQKGTKYNEIQLHSIVRAKFNLAPDEITLLIVQLKVQGVLRQDSEGNFVGVLYENE